MDLPSFQGKGGSWENKQCLSQSWGVLNCKFLKYCLGCVAPLLWNVQSLCRPLSPPASSGWYVNETLHIAQPGLQLGSGPRTYGRHRAGPCPTPSMGTCACKRLLLLLPWPQHGSPFLSPPMTPAHLPSQHPLPTTATSLHTLDATCFHHPERLRRDWCLLKWCNAVAWPPQEQNYPLNT